MCVVVVMEEMLGSGAAGSAGPQDPCPRSQTFARGEARSPAQEGRVWRGGGGGGGRAEGANAEAVTTSRVLRRIPGGTPSA